MAPAPVSALNSADLIQALPAAVYTCDADGYVVTFNAAAVELWGRSPETGKDRWCGSPRIFLPDGNPLALEDCPMAVTLREGRPDLGKEIIIERTDGTRRHVIPYPTPIHDGAGRLAGAVNMLVDITRRKKDEEERELASWLPMENPSPVLCLHAGRVIHFANPAAHVLLDFWKVGSGDPAPPDLVRLCAAALESGERLTEAMTINGSSYLVRVAPAAKGGYVNVYFSDVSDLKRAEEALRLTEQRFVALAMNAPVAIFTKDAAGRYTLANPIACEALGRPGGVGGMSDHELLPKNLADAIRSHDLEVIRGGKPVQSEAWVHDRRFLSSKFPLRNAAGEPVGVCGVSLDITARHRAESLLRESEERFRTLASHAPVGIFLSAANGDAIFVNECWCEMAGLTPDEAAGGGWAKSLHPDDRDRVLGGWDEAVRSHDSSESEFRFLRPDGTLRWVQGSALKLHDEQGVHTGYIGSCVDITARKRADEELAAVTAESERKRRLYEGLLSTTPDLAYVFGKDHRFTYANEALLKMWGKTWEESVGKNCLEIGYEPWHAEMHGREIDQVVATGRPLRGEVPFTGTEGRRIYDYILTPLFGADGRVEAVAGITRDVTDRKHGEDRADFLIELTGRLADITRESEIVAMTVEALGRRLGAHRCYFVECLPDKDLLTVKSTWRRDDAPDLAGTYTLHDFGGEEWWRQYSSGNFAVEDVRTHPLTVERVQSYLHYGVLSYAVQPFNADGRRTVVLAATDDRPRAWTADEMSLIENVIARVWPLVERARSEAALRESRRQMRLVADHVPALISYLDRDQIFRFANDRYQEWFGIKPAELKGKVLASLLGEETYRQRAPYIARVLHGQTVRFEGPTCHHELGWRDLEIAYVPDFKAAAEVRGFYVMATDITERKKSEKLLERQARRLRLLWEAAGIILSAENPDVMLQRVFGKISALLEVDTFFNFMVNESGDGLALRSCHGITAQQQAEIARLDFGQAVCGTVAQRRRAMVACSIQESDSPLVQLVKGYGIRAYACHPLVAGDELLGTLSFASCTRDDFDPDELEFMETICHYVTGAYVRLRLVDDLRAGDRRKDEFLATLAHELRNPLAPIRTGLEVMKMSSGNPAGMERIRATMERQVEQLVMLVNDLLDVSRITRGKLRLRKTPADLAGIVRSAVEASQPVIHEVGHRLRIDLPEEPVLLEADPHRLAQVISNLLNNAAKYTDPGGMIELEVSSGGGEALILVRDSGIGIPADMLDRIFGMFEQIDSPSGGDYGGLGIGLTLVKSLVEMHGGKVRAESAGPGKGSTFSFRLPVLQGVSAEEVETPPEADSSGPFVKRKVLVVDDNQAAASTMAMAIEYMGHEVRVASDGREGIGVAESFLPEVILMDLGMPVMDGWEAARRIRSEAWGKDLMLVALTGWGQDEDRRRTREAGFDRHLVKPSHPAAIRELLQGKTS